MAPDDPAGDYASGLGLQNLRKRLELIYPERYELKLKEKNGIFDAYLGIELGGFLRDEGDR
jgi:LytS/YehU family sensor histidine kinase